MSNLRRLTGALAAAVALGAATAAPSEAIVGGHDTAPGAYPSVAQISFGLTFGCTGTLIAPTWVLTAGHCGSITGDAVGTPAAWPAALIDVYIGGDTAYTGAHPAVKKAYVNPAYFGTKGYDITLLELKAPVAGITPTKVAGTGEASLWAPGTMERIVGWGVTQENGSAPDHLQEAQVPVQTDAACAASVGSSYESATQLCAGYPEGGIDTCQGDSGGPMFGQTATGVLRVVGATSYGAGCAQPNAFGVYARVGDSVLREWIRSKAPAGVA